MSDHWAMRRAERIETFLVMSMAFVLVAAGIGFSLFVLVMLGGGR